MPLSKNAREILESELLLSKGGGIYYDAARVTADEKTATLFVGLGGTGADMLIRIKNEVKRRMILPQNNEGRIVGDTPRNIGFLAFDTDQDTMAKTWGIASFDRFGKEFCSLSVDDIPKVVENRCKLVDLGELAWQWYEKIPGDSALKGANGKRQIGRLLLFENVKKVVEKIQSRVTELQKSGEGIKSVNVMLVTGISGGTGSGTFIDMAYLIREALNMLDVQNKQILGFIVLPDVNLLRGGNKDKLSANAYASLKELDYWMERDRHESVFAQNYGQGVEIRISFPVFEYCHLLSAQDFEGNPLSYDKVISSMAEFVFAYVAGEAGGQVSGNTAIESMYNNINGYIDVIETKARIPANYRYLAVGTHKLEIPYEEISTLLAIRLFEKLEPVFGLLPTEETFKNDMTVLRLVPQNVIHDSLLDNIPASPIDGKPNYQYNQIWGGTNDGFDRNAVYFDVHEWRARSFQAGVTENASNFANVHNGFFLTFMKDRMKKTKERDGSPAKDGGPTYLTALIKSDSKWSIIPTLEGIASHCDNVASKCYTQRSAKETALRAAYNAGSGKILGKQSAVDSYISALRDWAENENSVLAYTERAAAVRKLIDKLSAYYEKIFIKLSNVIEALPEIFHQNLDYINIAHREAQKLNQLDTTKLIWPQDFEKKNRVEFEKLLDSACSDFLESLTNDLAKWTGCDLDTLDEGAGIGTDVPGFISDFVSAQFGSLLSINMEEIMTSKLSGTEGFEDYLHDQLLKLKDRSIPMFNVDSAFRTELGGFDSEFAIVSVPEDCLHIERAANEYYDDHVTKKKSREKTRLYYVKVSSGIPLFMYSRIKECAKLYKSLMSVTQTRKGTHLDPRWADFFPTPYPEAAWASDYTDEENKAYNAKIRADYDRCLETGIIYADGQMCRLKLADPGKIKLLETEFAGSINDRLDDLNTVETELWGADTIELPQMGNSSSTSLEIRTRESILHIPRICGLISEQIALLDK
ncbi:MAG: tubulin-like doman-containing protein, partial [Peptococcaceae bacterium]|nr:tubulin-like doman-containing protein [Peptococcaceae bacterium]